MVALFVLLSFALFIALDVLVFRSKWANVLKDAPGTEEVPQDAFEHMPEVGLTMADGKPEEDEDKKKEEK